MRLTGLAPGKEYRYFFQRTADCHSEYKVAQVEFTTRGLFAGTLSSRTGPGS